MFLRPLFSAEPIETRIGMFADFLRTRRLRSAAAHEGYADEANDGDEGDGVGCSDYIHCSNSFWIVVRPGDWIGGCSCEAVDVPDVCADDVPKVCSDDSMASSRRMTSIELMERIKPWHWRISVVYGKGWIVTLIAKGCQRDPWAKRE